MTTVKNTAASPEWEIRTKEPYYMGESIAKVPGTIEACLDPKLLASMAAALANVKPTRIIAIGTGTSFNASESIAYSCRKLFNIPAEAYDALDFELDTPLGVDSHSLIISISHSGRTLQTVLAVKKAKSLGAFTVGISANAGTPLLTTADFGLTDPNPYEGRPRGKTRSYHSSVLLGTLAAVMTAAPDVREAYIAGAHKIAAQIQAYQTEWEKAGRKVASEWAGVVSRYLVAGFGAQKPNAYEIGLKIIEVLAENATSYSLEELTHGPGACFRKDLGIILFQTDPRTVKRCVEIAKGVRESAASVVVFTNQTDAGWPKGAHVIGLPAVDRPEIFGLYPAAAAAQHLLYFLAIGKGINPDENSLDTHPELDAVKNFFFPPGTH